MFTLPYSGEDGNPFFLSIMWGTCFKSLIESLLNVGSHLLGICTVCTFILFLSHNLTLSLECVVYNFCSRKKHLNILIVRFNNQQRDKIIRLTHLDRNFWTFVRHTWIRRAVLFFLGVLNNIYRDGMGFGIVCFCSASNLRYV